MSRDGRTVCFQPEVLEHRMLPSGISFSLEASGSALKEVVSLQVPSTYVSQSATSIDVTIMRSMGSKQVAFKSPLTLSLSAEALVQASKRGGTPQVSHEIAKVDQSVTIPAGETTQTVTLPINVLGPLPALVPVQITASPRSDPHTKAVIMEDLASSQQLIPPSITHVSIVRDGSAAKGIAVTFSQPMSPASVEDIHNYVVKSVPLDQVTLSSVGSLSVLQPTAVTAPTPVKIPLKAARYNAATNTVLLVPSTPLTVAKSFIVKSPASLGTGRTGPKIARPLTDANGNVLNPLNRPEGSFTITINPKSS